MSEQKQVLISISDKSIGFVSSDQVRIQLHLMGFRKQKALIRFLINDGLGATRFSLRDEERELKEGYTVLPFTWQVGPEDPPGIYLITAQVLSELENWRAISTESFEVVVPGTRHPKKLPAAPRDHLLDAQHPFSLIEEEKLIETFQVAHEACQLSRNEEGSWGRTGTGLHLTYRGVGNVALGYLYAYEALGEEEYKTLALGGLDYLLSEQEENGGFRWWNTPEGTMNPRDPFYDTGWAGLSLAEGFRISGDARYLKGVRKAADWTMTCPFTGNNNYDAFALWFLSLLYTFTEEKKYLDTAVERTEGGIFFAQLPRGGWPAHNFHIGYHSIIANGLASLYDVLPEGHPFEDRLRKRLCMVLNLARYLQTAEGDFYQGWEYDRDFYIDEESRPVGRTGPARPELIRAFYKIRKQLGVSRNLFNGLCQSIIAKIKPLQDRPEGEKRNAASLMDIGLLLKWAREAGSD